MEGPSLVIAAEEFRPYLNRSLKASGTAALPFAQLTRQKLRSVKSWGKHFILVFDSITLRIHFLMFGSYRINNPRENRVPKMELKIGTDVLQFYSCAIKALDKPYQNLYDWSTDTMSPEFDREAAAEKLKKSPESYVCDALMDQTIFSGVGNIIKNEVLFHERLHPETKLGAMTPAQRRALIKEVQAYCHQFYDWKKLGQLKRHWEVVRKNKCPRCDRALTKEPTGKGERISFYCKHDQPKRRKARAKRTRRKAAETL